MRAIINLQLRFNPPYNNSATHKAQFPIVEVLIEALCTDIQAAIHSHLVNKPVVYNMVDDLVDHKLVIKRLMNKEGFKAKRQRDLDQRETHLLSLVLPKV